ncbi:MAG: tetraacyldisaccharide 4'-kinase [Bdellovibrionales bacterium]|nr:tetraacyldisaccharide 4'-kinase [Bdellovibrionales bacterium]
MNWIMRPLSHLYSGVMWTRNWVFDQQILKSQEVSVPVLSVGNLTTGGTGKTPMVALLIRELEKRNIRVGIVSRGYKGNFKDYVEVDLHQPWEIFGDEPTMLKQQFPKVPICLSPRRVRAAQELTKNHQVDLIVADDGFQHRILQRNLDIVLFDATVPMSTYQVLPEGRLREPLSSLKRAQWMVVTKWNLLSESEKEQKQAWFDRLADVWKIKWLKADLQSVEWVDWEGERVSNPDPDKSALLSGIGNPLAFEASVRMLLGSAPAKHFVFEDHHHFKASEVQNIVAQLKSNTKVLTTEKDMVRLREFEELRSCLLALKTEMTLGGSTDEFWTQIVGLTR